MLKFFYTLLIYYHPSTFSYTCHLFIVFIYSCIQRYSVVKWTEHRLESDKPELEPWYHHLHTVWSQISHLTSLILVFSSMKGREWYKLKRIMSSLSRALKIFYLLLNSFLNEYCGIVLLQLPFLRSLPPKFITYTCLWQQNNLYFSSQLLPSKSIFYLPLLTDLPKYYRLGDIYN